MRNGEQAVFLFVCYLEDLWKEADILFHCSDIWLRIFYDNTLRSYDIELHLSAISKKTNLKNESTQKDNFLHVFNSIIYLLSAEVTLCASVEMRP